MNMITIYTFADSDSRIINNHEDGALFDKDPLDGLHESEGCGFYRLQETVFAKPLDIHIDNTEPKMKGDEFIFKENITIQKRNGKRNRYHMNIDTQNPVCPQTHCARSYATPTLLKAHIRKVHCADRSFICELCPLRFPAKYLLERHKVTHTLVKRECPVCGKMLSARTNLKVHVASHRDHRPYSCHHCDNMFTRRFTLQRHLEMKHNTHGDSFRGRKDFEESSSGNGRAS